MVARRLQLGFSIASMCTAAIVLVIVLDASVVQDEAALDLSRGRDVVLILSVAFLAASAYLSYRSLRLPKAEVAAEEMTEVEVAEEVTVETQPEEEATPDEDEVLSSLPEDELKLYLMIDDAGGEMLQMNIVGSKVFSKAKVTRLLDKLEKRELVVRERHGMTNRIRIIR